MEPTQKPITVVYRVALLSLVVIAAFTLLALFGHRGHKSAALADPLIVAVKYVSAPTGHAHASHRSTMALSTTGYTASGAGTTAANGNYVPCAAPNATFNGATQCTNGADFLAYNGTGSWGMFTTVNSTGIPLYSAAGSVSTFPLFGWTNNTGTPPAPTFTDMSGGGGSTVRRRPPIFF